MSAPASPVFFHRAVLGTLLLFKDLTALPFLLFKIGLENTFGLLRIHLLLAEFSLLARLGFGFLLAAFGFLIFLGGGLFRLGLRFRIRRGGGLGLFLRVVLLT